MKQLRKFLERRLHPRKLADIPAQLRVTGGLEQGYIGESCAARVLDVSEGGMRLAVTDAGQTLSHLTHCLEDAEAYPIEIIVSTPRGGRWTFLGRLKRLVSDGGTGLEVAVQFPDGVALPANWTRLWGVAA